MARQAAIAIENARLYQQAQSLAILEERQRLARELHDSVSQALYGIGLGAKTARALLERDPQQATDAVDYVIGLAEAGLTEMRALIFELRPDTIEREGLVAALDRQVQAAQRRHEIRVTTSLGTEPDIPLAVKESLYRITQEALQNVVKHAPASAVQVTLQQSADELTLEIRDDGPGFDSTLPYHGHLGLRSMHERANRHGGRLRDRLCARSGHAHLCPDSAWGCLGWTLPSRPVRGTRPKRCHSQWPRCHPEMRHALRAPTHQ